MTETTETTRLCNKRRWSKNTPRLNLHLLGQGLLDNVELLDRGRFDMGHFTSEVRLDPTLACRPTRLHSDCGSTACAVGWAPVMLEMTREELFDHKLLSPPDSSQFAYPPVIFWGDLCRLAFGVQPVSTAWEWLFDMSWARTDNTAYGAAGRIGAWLGHGEDVMALIRDSKEADEDSDEDLSQRIDIQWYEALREMGVSWLKENKI